jgi:hypothetical protein
MDDARRATAHPLRPVIPDTSLTPWVYLAITIIAIAWAATSPALEI